MKIENILLLRPPLLFLKSIGFEEPHPPLELAYLGAVLEKDYKVTLIDAFGESHQTGQFDNLSYRAGMSDQEITAKIQEIKPDVVCFSAMWSNQKRMIDYMAGLIKSLNPQIITVAGGNLCSAIPELMVKNQNIDYVVVGEGERSLEKLPAYLKKGITEPRIPGLVYRKNGQTYNYGRDTIEDLDNLPLPAYHLLNFEAYATGFQWGRVTSPRVIGILPTRGCTFSCNFCCLHNVGGRIFRHHSVERVISEMQILKNKYQAGEIQFYDYNLLNEPEFAKSLFRAMIKAKIDLPWVTTAGLSVWELSDEMLELAVESGMYRLELPIESSSKETRKKIMAKDLYDNANIRQIIRKVRSLGLKRLYAYVIVGSPGESKESIKESLYLLNELDVDVRVVKYAQPFPGTRFFEICEKNGYLLPDFSYDRLWFSLPNIKTGQVSPQYVLSLVQADKAYSLAKRKIRNLWASILEVVKRFGLLTALRTGCLLACLSLRYRKIKFIQKDKPLFLKYFNNYNDK